MTLMAKSIDGHFTELISDTQKTPLKSIVHVVIEGIISGGCVTDWTNIQFAAPTLYEVGRQSLRYITPLFSYYRTAIYPNNEDAKFECDETGTNFNLDVIYWWFGEKHTFLIIDMCN